LIGFNRLIARLTFILLLLGFGLLTTTCAGFAQAVPWTKVDLGTVPVPGTFTYTAGTPPTFTVQGSGYGLPTAVTEVYTPSAGNVDFEAKLDSQSSSATYAFAGISMMDSLDAANAGLVILGAQPGPGLELYYRTHGGTLTNIGNAVISLPYWIRLANNGNTISGYYSTDGINWTLLGSYSGGANFMPPLYYSGFMVSNYTAGTLDTAVFDHVTYATSVPQLASNLALWLRSDVGVTSSSGLVSSWTDQSGNGYTATQNSGSLQPSLTTGAINSGVLPTISFNGTSQYLSLPSGLDTLSSGASIFVMTKPQSATATGDFCAFGNASNSDACISQAAGAQAALFAYNGTTSSSITTSSSPLSTSNYQLVEEIYQPGAYASTAAGTIFVNGVQQIQSTTLQNLNTVSRAKSIIGAGIGPTSYYQGSIAEILVYSTAVSAAQRRSIESYFLSKYGVGTQPTLDLAVLTPGPGIYASSQSVSMSQPENATIFYTLDGTLPNPATSPWFNGTALSVTSNETIQTLAVAPFFNNSAVGGGLYQIDSTTSAVPRTGLVLWLRADNSVTANGSNQISLWGDVSGSQNNATQGTTANQPILTANSINSLPAVTFDGTAAYFQLNQILADFSPGASVIAVVEPTAVSANATLADLENCAPGTNLSLKEPSTNAAALNVFNSNWNSTINSTNAVTVSSFQILEAVLPPPIASSYTNTILNLNNPLAAANNYVGRASAGSNYFHGLLAELYVYNTPLTPTNRTALEGYLSTKYNITLASAFPQQHRLLTRSIFPSHGKRFPLLSAFNR
jgi:Concanavalin A-like lectin/glucanases superfamily/Chitobiase/beta-hexosaminidase C-terminal domain